MITIFVKALLEVLTGKNMEKALKAGNGMNIILIIIGTATLLMVFRLNESEEQMLASIQKNQKDIANIKTALFYEDNIDVDHPHHRRDNDSKNDVSWPDAILADKQIKGAAKQESKN